MEKGLGTAEGNRREEERKKCLQWVRNESGRVGEEETEMCPE